MPGISDFDNNNNKNKKLTLIINNCYVLVMLSSFHALSYLILVRTLMKYICLNIHISDKRSLRHGKNN